MTTPNSSESESKEQPPATASSVPVAPQPAATPAKSRKPWKWIAGGAVLLLIIIGATPSIIQSFNTVSTDDAYVNGRVTFVAPRIPGQVSRVLVDDNNRVHKGDLLVQLDKEPYQVQLDIAQAAVTAAQSDLVTADAQARATEGQMRSLRFALQ